MVFCFIIAILSTLMYINIILSDAINLRVNPVMSASKDENMALKIVALKYLLILLMSVFWSIIITHYLK